MTIRLGCVLGALVSLGCGSDRSPATHGPLDGGDGGGTSKGGQSGGPNKGGSSNGGSSNGGSSSGGSSGAGGRAGQAGDAAAPPVVCTPATAPASGFHVSPSGSPTGDGSAANPWDIATALAPAPQIAPGDTVWLHGGVYSVGTVVSKLAGTQANPIVVRSYPGEWAVIDGAGATDSIFQVYRSYATYRDFEIRDSTPHGRTARQSGTWMEGTGIHLVNLVIHDTGNVAMYEEAPDLEVYGCLIYAIGFDDPDPTQRSHGHNLYVQNQTGTKLFAENVVFNGYSFGIHAYAETGSHLIGMHFVGNVLFGAGAAAAGTDGNKDNLLVGNTAEAASGIVVQDNLGWARPVNERSVSFGYGVPNGALTLADNYLVGTVAFSDPWSPLDMQNNTFIGAVQGAVDTSLFPKNNYVAAAPTATRVFVRPNAYEPGRAHIVVYNWGHDSSVSVDASSVLAPGTPFEVRRAQDYFGTPVLSGTFDGNPLSIPITGAPPVQPIGAADAIDPTEMTGIDFDVFVLRATCKP